MRVSSIKFLSQISLVFSLVMGSLANESAAYNLPSSQEKPLNDESIQALQKISRGVSLVAQHAEKAVVFVSVYKTTRGLPPGMIDPFEFFFGNPGGGNGGGGGREQGKRVAD
jgi:hypothetical protein